MNRTLVSFGPDNDDGLTDGQELKGVTLWSSERFGELFRPDHDLSSETNPTDADSDGDGYWDGWVGVYGVGKTDNVVLYMEHLQTANGVDGDEAVREQVGTHMEGGEERANLQLGERHWGSDPAEPTDDADDETRLKVEVDYVEGRDPRNVVRNNVSVLDAAEQNFALYRFNIEFEVDDKLTMAQLNQTCKAMIRPRVGVVETCPDNTPAQLRINVTAGSFNRYELGLIEDIHHDDDSTMHMLWGTRFGNDQPRTIIDERLDFTSLRPGGHAWNNGAPGSERVSLIESDFGVAIAHDEYSNADFQGLQSVTMHETGHALGAGWADDTPIPFAGFACDYDGDGVIIDADKCQHEYGTGSDSFPVDSGGDGSS